MKKVLQHEKYGDIVYAESIWSGKKTLSVGGKELQKTSKTTFLTEEGVAFAVTGNFLTGTNLTVQNETISLFPRVKWYEIALSLMPFLLILVWGNSKYLCGFVPVLGGALGGALSAVFAVLNVFLIKGVKSVWLKTLISICTIADTFLVCFLLAKAILNV